MLKVTAHDNLFELVLLMKYLNGIVDVFGRTLSYFPSWRRAQEAA